MSDSQLLSPVEAWVLARLRAGHDLNGEIDQVSDPYLNLARQMASRPIEDRERVWNDHLSVLPKTEAEALISAVAAVNPAGPPPEGEPWEPLRLGELPPVEPFPDIVLPDPVADFVRVVSDSIGCPPDYVGLSLLIAAGAANGRRASLLLKSGYFASTSLYGMNIGGPSSGKSPAQEAAVLPMQQIDETLYETYKTEKKRLDEERAALSKTTKGKPKTPPSSKATLESVVLEDCTVESVAALLAINPRGLLVVRDEGAAWFTSLNQYKSGGRGSDRQFWLSALFGKPVRVDRKGNLDMVPIRVPHPFLSFIGGMPQDMLFELRERHGRVDGFVERILFAFPEPRPRRHWSEEGIPDEVRATWSEIVQRLRSLPMAIKDGKEIPQIFHLAPDAKATWIDWYNTHVDAVNAPGFDPRELAVEGKLCDFAARLALILELLHRACDPTGGDPDRPRSVSRWAVSGAIKLWSYFRSHHRRVRWFIGGGVGNPDARTILAWIRKNGLLSFPESDLTRNFPRFRDDPVALGMALEWIKRRNGIHRAPEPERPPGKRGRRPRPVWNVNPACHAPENCEDCSNSDPGANSRNQSNSPAPPRAQDQEGHDDGMHAL